jgi:hypothetical protein
MNNFGVADKSTKLPVHVVHTRTLAITRVVASTVVATRSLLLLVVL